MENDETIKPEVKAIIDEKQALLKQEFNFYTFAVDINSEMRINTIGATYNRLLEKELIDMREELDSVHGELTPIRMMT